MNLCKATASIVVPDQKEGPQAFSRITHLGIGAHQDDLEFMGDRIEGILQEAAA